jgi:hypothetical protein
MAAVSVRWLTSDPERGRQGVPEWTSPEGIKLIRVSIATGMRAGPGDSKAFGGLVAEEFHAVSALDQRDALGRQPFELDRSHF